MKTFMFLFLAGGCLLPAQLSVPQLGAARYRDGSVHLIRGVGANAIIGPRIAGTVRAISFSDSLGMIATRAVIQLLNANGTLVGAYLTREQAPVLHVDSTPASALAWLPSKHLLIQWNGTGFQEIPVDDSSFGGPVTFVQLAASNVAQFFVKRADSSVGKISVGLPGGSVTSADLEPDATGAVASLQGWTVWQNEGGLIAEQANGNKQIISLQAQTLPAGDLTLEQMSSHWLHVSSASLRMSWAVYLDAAKVEVSQLPPPVKEIYR